MASMDLAMLEREQLLFLAEVGARYLANAPWGEKGPKVTSPDDAFQVFRDMECLEQEELRVALLDTPGHVQRIITVSKGSLNSVHLRLADLFREAVRDNVASIIVAHNHPSGDPTPSALDIDITLRLIEAGKLLGVTVLDHLVIGANGRYVSLKERNPLMGWEV